MWRREDTDAIERKFSKEWIEDVNSVGERDLKECSRAGSRSKGFFKFWCRSLEKSCARKAAQSPVTRASL